ncbi:MAG: hypothetical protein J6B82_05725 [Bacteroidaceae bacterium]|nr:hypothetical protein [Bacteroidaceae bacterium]
MSSNGSGDGMGLTGVLTTIFIVLKLCHVIDWSWWWVLSPTLICIAFRLVLILIYIGIDKYENWKWKHK